MPYSPDHLNVVVRGQGPPLFLLHGCPATWTIWSPVLDTLAERHTLYAFDLPGFGASPQPVDRNDLAIGALARLILEYAAWKGIEQFDLVGHSYGGALAATVADLAPGRIVRLALIAPMGCTPPPAGRLIRFPGVAAVTVPSWRVAPGSLRRLFVRIGMKINYGAAHTPARSRQLEKELDRPAVLGSMAGLMKGVDFDEYRRVVERLERVHSMPVLMLGARKDKVVPPRHFDEVCALLSRAESRLYPEGVHVLMWQYPGEVASVLEQFLDGRTESKDQGTKKEGEGSGSVEETGHD